jgi:hypothetical protein
VIFHSYVSWPEGNHLIYHQINPKIPESAIPQMEPLQFRKLPKRPGAEFRPWTQRVGPGMKLVMKPVITDWVYGFMMVYGDNDLWWFMVIYGD